MAMACEICGKKPSFGNTISHANNVTRRRWNPESSPRESRGRRRAQAGPRLHRLHPRRPRQEGRLIPALARHLPEEFPLKRIVALLAIPCGRACGFLQAAEVGAGAGRLGRRQRQGNHPRRKLKSIYRNRVNPEAPAPSQEEALSLKLSILDELINNRNSS